LKENARSKVTPVLSPSWSWANGVASQSHTNGTVGDLGDQQAKAQKRSSYPSIINTDQEHEVTKPNINPTYSRRPSAALLFTRTVVVL